MSRSRLPRPALRATALLAGLAMLLGAAPAQALLITELMASNTATIADDDGEYSDWIELYNESGSSVNLDGLYLTDDELAPTKWRLPAVSLGAGQYLLVWASDKNRQVPGQPLHANFRLSSSGEYLGLVAADGVSVLHEYVPAFPSMAADRTHGLASDLATTRCFAIPTPGAPNNESAECVTTSPVTFSPARGFYDAPIQVTLATATPGATIHYTLDGSDPTSTHGLVYSGPIDVTTNAMVRAMAFGPGLDPTPSVTHTYIYLDDILVQSIADQPPEYLFTVADYDMDPDVVNDPAYSATIKDDLKDIPTLSIVTDVDHLFGPQNGIYVHRSGRGVAWERPTSVELIHADGTPGFQINCGIRMQGGVSRLSDMGKYSFRLLFKGDYGPSKLVYPFFAGSPVDSFDTFTLTATHGNSWAAGHSRAEYIRDTWMKDTQLAMGQASAHTTYVQLYLNGRYWGLYRPTERPSAPFLASYFGGVEEDYDALNSGEAIDGDRVAWDTMIDLAQGPVETPAGYDAIRQYVDLENLADYMMINIYAGNTDWPDKNWYAGRRRAPGEGFRFFNWDGEQTFETATANRVNVATYDSPAAVYANLRQRSAEFRLLFADRVHRHFFNGGALTPEKAAERWRKRRDQIFRAIVGESARWGDRRREKPFTRDLEWIIENQRLLLSIFPARTRIQLEQFRSAGLYPLVDAPEFSQHGGTYFPGAEVSISAAAGTILFTTDGSDPRLAGGATSPTASAYASPIPLAGGVTLKARALSAGTWSALTEATFTPASPLRITELMYNPAAGTGAEYLEIRNIGVAPVDLAGVALTTGVTFTFPGGVLAPGDHVLVVENTVTFAAVYGGGHPVAGQYSGRQDNGGERIVLRDAGGSAIHDFEYDDAWYPLTDGPGRSLVIRDATGALEKWSVPDGWRASGAGGGTPGGLEPRLCANGLDDDGDGGTDLADNGCADAAADDEAPECNDGVDNDLDGHTDLGDLHCSTASRDSEEPDAGDSYFCYTARNSSDTPFASTEVAMEDEYDGTVASQARAAQSICMSGSLDRGPVFDAGIHLRAYELGAVAGEPLHVPRTGLRYESVLGPVYVDTTQPTRLLVPAAVDPAAPVAEPVFAAHGVDFYRCYRTRLTKYRPRYLPSLAQVHFDDAFEDRDYLLKTPTRVCTPASLDGGPVKVPHRHLLCLRAGRGRYATKHVPRANVHVSDAFGAARLGTSREEEICVPAVPVEE